MFIFVNLFLPAKSHSKTHTIHFSIWQLLCPQFYLRLWQLIIPDIQPKVLDGTLVCSFSPYVGSFRKTHGLIFQLYLELDSVNSFTVITMVLLPLYPDWIAIAD